MLKQHFLIIQSENGIFININNDDPEIKNESFVNLVDIIKDHILLEKELEELKKTVNEIYYSPNGPGFIEAQTHFETIKK